MTRRKPLSTVVAENLFSKIRSGALAPGGRLPTEAELCEEYEVSRTVVREAIARLRSDGLVIPQPGRGMFVSEAPKQRNFSVPDETLKSLPETISLLELRLSVEVEAAGLCAQRRTDAEAAEIRRLMEQVDARHDDPDNVVIHYDYDFHLAIAKATRNEFIYGFLGYLKPIIAPRFQLGQVVAQEQKGPYYTRIHGEHVGIVDAIERKEARHARQAMRSHLQNSLERFRALALASGIDAGGADVSTSAAALFGRIGTPPRPEE